MTFLRLLYSKRCDNFADLCVRVSVCVCVCVCVSVCLSEKCEKRWFKKLDDLKTHKLCFILSISKISFSINTNIYFLDPHLVLEECEGAMFPGSAAGRLQGARPRVRPLPGPQSPHNRLSMFGTGQLGQGLQ